MDNSNYIVACFWVRMPSKPVNKSSSMGVTCTGIRDLSRFQALFSSKDPCGKEKTIRIHAVGSPSGMGFMIRGRTYLKDNAKVMGGEPLLKLIAVDWLNVDKAVDHIALHPNCLVQVLPLPALCFDGLFFYKKLSNSSENSRKLDSCLQIRIWEHFFKPWRAR
ncbi:PREDICTED: uncharacterized protein LOC104809858 isoform X2 [Tarenaya hassleriana]|uniref:uncharacterized protein LOC104809858 isoform X2 n=1 Tax=Tarenaya hassleriana TaxID=28532 RepID=UPI0008FD7B67|nr:PREDICTED: uncharacterized protein LOC104809858 isoform X2 [Tarenaya hassleriana]